MVTKWTGLRVASMFALAIVGCKKEPAVEQAARVQIPVAPVAPPTQEAARAQPARVAETVAAAPLATPSVETSPAHPVLKEAQAVPGFKPGEMPDLEKLTKGVPADLKAARKMNRLFRRAPEFAYAWLDILEANAAKPEEGVQKGKAFVAQKMPDLKKLGAKVCQHASAIGDKEAGKKAVARAMIGLKKRFNVWGEQAKRVKASYAGRSSDLEAQQKQLLDVFFRTVRKCTRG